MKKISILSGLVLFIAGCANQTSPTGGPQDKTPPTLTKSAPENNQKNFKGKVITLYFDEDVKLKDPKEEILITPDIGKKTKYLVRKNSLTIQPENQWEDSTTYSINFRDAVQDITEGNPAENLKLAFSTGPIIDSLYISGKVSNRFNNQTPEKITVAIYQSDTFDIFKHIPVYFTKTDKQGNFQISNLKAGAYKIYAFDDKNKNLKVDSKTEKFDFQTTPIQLLSKAEKINLYLYNVDARELKITNIRHAQKQSSIRFNKEVKTLSLSGLNKNGVASFGNSSNELLIFKTLTSDSIPIKLIATDSTGQQADSTFYLKNTDTKLVEEQFKVSTLETTYSTTSRISTTRLNFNKLLQNINPDSCYIRIDSLTKIALSKQDFTIDTLHHKLSVSKKIETPKSEDKTETPNPLFYFGKGAFISIDNDSSKMITSQIILTQEDKTGTLLVEIETKEKSFFVELISDKKIIARIKNINKHTFTNLDPSTYSLRITIDSNEDFQWSPGNFYKGQEAEKVILYKNQENKTDIPIRANWEYGPLRIKF